MGLDVTAYKNLTITNDENDEYFYISEQTFEQEDREPGEFLCKFDDAYYFSAGSYIGYNLFRNVLCKTINGIEAKKLWKLDVKKPKRSKSLPFYWLINFSDCDGYIGTNFCKILYKNFVDYEQEYKQKVNEDYLIMMYDEFKTAFELAQDNGIVVFH